MTTLTRSGRPKRSGGARRGAGRKAHVMLRGLRAGTTGRTRRGKLLWRIVDDAERGLMMHDAGGDEVTISVE
jgi:hypothetical protein